MANEAIASTGRIDVEAYKDRLVSISSQSRNFGDVVARGGRLVVYVVGQPDVAVRRILKMAPARMQVAWKPAPYTRRELLRAAGEILSENPTVSGVAIAPGAKGLEVVTVDERLLNARRPELMLGSDYPIFVEFGKIVPAMR